MENTNEDTFNPANSSLEQSTMLVEEKVEEKVEEHTVYVFTIDDKPQWWVGNLPIAREFLKKTALSDASKCSSYELVETDEDTMSLVAHASFLFIPYTYTVARYDIYEVDRVDIQDLQEF